MSINLLPPELRPKGYLIGISKTINKISLISILVLLISGSLILASYIFLKHQLSTSVKKQNEFKNSINALEGTEQKMILIRNRLQKINEIETSENVNKSIAILEGLLETVDERIILDEVELKPASAEIVIIAGGSLDLTRFLRDVVSRLNLVRVELLTLEFSPQKGYEMKLSLSR